MILENQDMFKCHGLIFSRSFFWLSLVISMTGCSSLSIDKSSQFMGEFVTSIQAISAPQELGGEQANQGPLHKPRQWQRKRKSFVPSDPSQVRVWLFSSLASQAQLMRLGADPTTGIRMWENYLNFNRIPFVRITSADDIDTAKISGVLILPSVVVMSESEKEAVKRWRERGGSVLSTWLTAAYSATGESIGYSFMRDVLDVVVSGNTQDEIDDTYMVMKGDNPVSNSPAGLRVWLERVPNQLPLRLIGKNEAAYIMSWSRTLGAKKPAGLIAFDERRISKDITSRTVTLGFPEQNWLRSDTRQLSAITRGALSWLFREPHAYVGAWPSPYQNAILFAIQAAEPVRQAEVDIGNAYRKLGGVATYYVLGSNIDKAVPFVEKIAAQGHEIGFYGDIFESFDKQPESQQLERLETMKKQVLKTGLKIQEPFSFSTPMNGYDSTTRRLLEEKGFGNYLSFMELTESALPFVASRNSDGSPRTTVLPRTLTSPEEGIMEFGAEDGMTSYLDSLDMSTKMGGISVVSIPSENLIPPEELRRLFDEFSKLNDQSWFSSARQISHWWSQREGISVLLEPHPQGYSLSTTVTKAISSSNSIGIWINLPRLDSRIQILGLTDTDKSPAVLVKDGFRVVMNLSGPAVGQKKWLIKFD